ncbi:hypothetical protein VA7868_02430 [Vibrio aerogenes CECT 7868]|uniref:Uncharacterized protein n=1 Tax=Vibrio aerogenes CECT 7868 TaxID=1216006 RepID=A0A1M5Z8D4_9VIBR|nr:hypothetical protein [Vibrio aerogenes]SHI20509.1 hypothetical protein VA7868_02430 [Vibrio aerogenes CECT 7868]
MDSFGEGIFSRLQDWGDAFGLGVKNWAKVHVSDDVRAGMTVAGRYYHSGGAHISESLSAQGLEVSDDVLDKAYGAAAIVAGIARSKSFKSVKSFKSIVFI